jgi:hypothetical protein
VDARCTWSCESGGHGSCESGKVSRWAHDETRICRIAVDGRGVRCGCRPGRDHCRQGRRRCRQYRGGAAADRALVLPAVLDGLCGRGDGGSVRSGLRASSRRSLIHLVGKAGGVAAAYHTMAAMGLLAVPDAYAGPPALPPGRGREVVIIGAGIAGMVLAYELRKIRIPAADTGGAGASRRPQLVAARRRHGDRDRQHAARRLGPRRAACISIPGPARSPVPPRGHPVVLPRARRAARGDVQRQPRRADAGRPRVRRRAAAQPPGGERRARLCRGTGGEGGGQGPAGAAGQHGGQGTAACVPARASERWTRTLCIAARRAPAGRGRRMRRRPGKPNQPLDLRQILASDFWQGPMQFGDSRPWRRP